MRHFGVMGLLAMVVGQQLAGQQPVAAMMGEPVHLKMRTSGAAAMMLVTPARSVAHSKTRPGTLRVMPREVASPIYATLPLMGEGSAVFHVVIDEPAARGAGESGAARLWVDADGDGDLTNDPPCAWAISTETTAAGGKITAWRGDVVLNLGSAEAPVRAGVKITRVVSAEGVGGVDRLLSTIGYVRDYAPEGEVKFGEKTYRVMLDDAYAAGDFRPRAEGGGAPQVNLCIDVNANGKFDRQGEKFDVNMPFNIGGVSWRIVKMARNGLSFEVVKSEIAVEEIPPSPDLEVGKRAPAFSATGLDGKDVKFPDDFKGKVVMLDFWATWCAPCMAEIPNLVRVQERFRDKGFVVVGVTIDGMDQREKIEQMMKEKGMGGVGWVQVFDASGQNGEGRDVPVTRVYGVEAIPAAWLVDGDTGEVLAAGEEVRGERLEGTVGRVVEKKGAGK